MEQGREARGLEQVEVWEEAAVVEAREAVEVLEEVLRQAQAVIASAPTVVKK